MRQMRGERRAQSGCSARACRSAERGGQWQTETDTSSKSKTQSCDILETICVVENK